MKQLTVNDLLKWCNDAKAEGHGDKIVLVSDDEECNGFHALYDGLGLVGDTFDGIYGAACHDMSPREAQKKAILLS